jgi:hypothetical protein
MFQLCNNRIAGKEQSLHEIMTSLIGSAEESFMKSCHENFPFPFFLSLFDIHNFDFFASTDASFNFYDSFSKYLKNIQDAICSPEFRNSEGISKFNPPDVLSNHVSIVLKNFKNKKFCCNLKAYQLSKCENFEASCTSDSRNLKGVSSNAQCALDSQNPTVSSNARCALDACQKCIHNVLILKIYKESDFYLVNDLYKILIITDNLAFPSGISLDRFKKIKCIIFSNNFNSFIEKYPSSVEYLIFGDCFDQPIDHLPSSCRYLFLGNNFNQPLDNLPLDLEYLRLGAKFNKDINFLPSSLKAIRFGYDFNQQVDNLPNNLRKIEFGISFNQQVDCLPLNVTHIVFGKEFVKRLDHLKKNNLVQLCLHWLYPEKLLYSEYSHIRFFYCPNFFFS